VGGGGYFGGGGGGEVEFGRGGGFDGGELAPPHATLSALP
jgi:hypothetical protein